MSLLDPRRSSTRARPDRSRVLSGPVKDKGLARVENKIKYPDYPNVQEQFWSGGPLGAPGTVPALGQWYPWSPGDEVKFPDPVRQSHVAMHLAGRATLLSGAGPVECKVGLQTSRNAGGSWKDSGETSVTVSAVGVPVPFSLPYIKTNLTPVANPWVRAVVQQVDGTPGDVEFTDGHLTGQLLAEPIPVPNLDDAFWVETINEDVPSSWWRFNDGVSGAVIISNDGSRTLPGGGTGAPGMEIARGNTSFAVECFLRRTTWPGNVTKAYCWEHTSYSGSSLASGIAFYISSNMQMVFARRMNYATSEAAVSDPLPLVNGSWHHFVWSHDAPTNTTSLYMDGQLVHQHTFVVATAVSPDWRAQASFYNTQEYLFALATGSYDIDEEIWYAHTLSAGRVLAHYEAAGY